MSEKQLGELDYAGDDNVVPYQVEALDVRGRAVQLGSTLDRIIRRHSYPDPVSKLLSELIVLTVLLGTSLKFSGRLIVQTQTDGPVNLIVADYLSPNRIRAYARYDSDRLQSVMGVDAPASKTLLGKGVLALTIDQGSNTQRYQGIVELDGTDLAEAARAYFRQSEQIPTEVRLSVAKLVVPDDDNNVEQWRAGGLISQFLPKSVSRLPHNDLPGGNDDIDKLSQEVHDDAWRELVALLDTIEPTELLDPTIGSERLLYRLFNQRGVRVFEGTAVLDHCSCSREKIAGVISGFSAEELKQCIENDRIKVDCEFCSQSYLFDPSEFG